MTGENWTPTLLELKTGKLPKDPVKQAIFKAALNDPKILAKLEIQKVKRKKRIITEKYYESPRTIKI